MKHTATNPMKYPITIQAQTGSIEIPFQWLRLFASDQEIAGGEKRFEVESIGPWGLTKSITGLAMEPIHGTKRPGDQYDPVVAWRVWGMRTMHQCRSLGYDMGGRVSIAGKKRRAFTSSKLFRYYDPSVGADYKLFNCSILYVCKQ